MHFDAGLKGFHAQAARRAEAPVDRFAVAESVVVEHTGKKNCPGGKVFLAWGGR
jgi:hypothetical protein